MTCQDLWTDPYLAYLAMNTTNACNNFVKTCATRFLPLLLLVVMSVKAFTQETIMKMDKQPYNWLHRGVLFYRYYGLNKHTGQFLYCGQDGYLRPVATIERFADMVAQEMRNAQDAQLFIQESLQPMLVQFLELENGTLVTEDYIVQRRKLPDEYWGNIAMADRERALKVLDKYKIVKPAISKVAWQTAFFVIMKDGSLEEWKCSGDIFPLTIRGYGRSVVEKAGLVCAMPSPPGGF